MKFLFSSLIILLSSITGSAVQAEPAAGPVVDPTSICNGDVCSDPMLNIVDGFREGRGQFANQPLTGYSGKCFHLSPHYSADKAHHGGFIFEKTPGSIAITGRFNFFYEEDPYAAMSAQEMKDGFLQGGGKLSPGTETPAEVQLAHIYDETDIRYSYRSDVSKNNLFIIGSTSNKQGQVAAAVFCKMNRHH
ncbi:hypothetical protein ACLVWU_01620 [Bdellovibrio sp. HCB290]|uniref:hypothetical protein n=1 Tax=Bdellovibrio sp. HCB290 TaxID=3394356 RepID=UPI0039B45A3C